MDSSFVAIYLLPNMYMNKKIVVWLIIKIQQFDKIKLRGYAKAADISDNNKIGQNALNCISYPNG